MQLWNQWGQFVKYKAIYLKKNKQQPKQNKNYMHQKTSQDQCLSVGLIYPEII